jgi:hypothetical protein
LAPDPAVLPLLAAAAALAPPFIFSSSFLPTLLPSLVPGMAAVALSVLPRSWLGEAPTAAGLPGGAATVVRQRRVFVVRTHGGEVAWPCARGARDSRSVAALGRARLRGETAVVRRLVQAGSEHPRPAAAVRSGRPRAWRRKARFGTARLGDLAVCARGRGACVSTTSRHGRGHGATAATVSAGPK